jgi:hypothetical protein
VVDREDASLEQRLMSDLNMLAVTGGKERSEREWKALLEAAGFSVAAVHPVGGDTRMVRNVAIVEAKPA